ncbi:DUF4442 domain-containing protein [Agrobacterium vitis]|uniref:DUF4442 domain-containing protein n=1 Tax=Agrobacterium vitis TaxID=373 RepID=A0A368NRG7_AGRVI|nr:DUF4442 domain-containing protein [Agrobacterium vitis]KAA3517569.1 DUF4442 domain-containing protein [Agrobacterium vitis]KAA3526970.1 DUF4442 domain-containing protein [Agrobacterium vitis]MCF1477006.1 DUF4442 domain-containing protein [Agrobacterium vitis]MUZ95810.1 DUF4442 domain-containing protein [Agrobacterium vitis]MVA29689.1 DUF4442 domain-containing protein [Agrobacterium vitis]
MVDLFKLLKNPGYLPRNIRYKIFNIILGRYSIYFRTNRLKVVDVTSNEVVIALKNHRRLRDRQGCVHAMASSLACEYAAGVLVAQHVIDKASLVVKNVHVNFRKRPVGSIKAFAGLHQDEIASIGKSARGELSVAVHVVDSLGKRVIDGCVVVVWRPPKPS